MSELVHGAVRCELESFVEQASGVISVVSFDAERFQVLYQRIVILLPRRIGIGVGKLPHRREAIAEPYQRAAMPRLVAPARSVSPSSATSEVREPVAAHNAVAAAQASHQPEERRTKASQA